MAEWINTNWDTVGMVALSAVGIYAAVILFTRIVGLRSFSKMSGFDFAMTIAVGSVIASTLLTKNPPLLQGIAGLASIYALQLLISLLRKATPFEKMVDNSPLLLMEGKNICWHNMKKGRITEDDLRAKLREANILHPDQIRAVVLETTGDMSVIHSNDPEDELHEDLLQGVRR